MSDLELREAFARIIDPGAGWDDRPVASGEATAKAIHLAGRRVEARKKALDVVAREAAERARIMASNAQMSRLLTEALEAFETLGENIDDNPLMQRMHAAAREHGAIVMGTAR